MSSLYNKTTAVRGKFLILLYAISGLTALTYEVLWARMLSVQFGVSIFGVVSSVTAFMLGLGGGSLLGLRLTTERLSPLRLFGALEISIGAYALILPTLLEFANGWMERAAASLSLTQWYGVQGGSAIFLVGLPALAMGIAFPLVLKAAQSTCVSLKKVYGANTLGAAAGALLPLWTLPTWGWTASLQATAAISMAVGLGALILSRHGDTLAKEGDELSWRPSLRSALLYAGVGATSLMLEMSWIKLYGMVMLRTEYVLGVILAVYLLGIGLGSLLAPRSAANWAFTLLPILAATFTLLGLSQLAAVSSWIERHEFHSLGAALSTQALILAASTLPVTLILGIWFPLLSQYSADSDRHAVSLYAMNALGGALGALVAGLLEISLIGTAATVALAGFALAALGLAWGKSRVAWLALPLLAFAALPLWHLPAVATLLPKTLGHSRDLYFHEDLISTTHVVQQEDGQRLLLTDLQRMDASTDPSAWQIQADEARLPLLLRPAAQDVLFLGVGTGISIAGSLPFPNLKRYAVEISRGAIFAANHWFENANGNAMHATTVYRDDVRHFLSATNQNYDVIIGDLFHPDLAGLGSLLSVQEFERARAHLRSNGVFVQWLALNQFDVQSFNAVLRGFRHVFPDAVLFMDGMHVALVGSRGHLAGATPMMQNLARLSPADRQAATGGEGLWTWLGRFWGPLPDTTGPVEDEWIPYIEFRLPQARYAGALDLKKLLIELSKQRPDAKSAMATLGVTRPDLHEFERAYVASDLIVEAWIASLSDDDAKAVRLTWFAYRANPRDRWIAGGVADTMLQMVPQANQYGLTEGAALLRILKVDPLHTDTLRALWHWERAEGNMREAERYRLQLLAAAPLDQEASLTKMGARP